MTAEKHSHGCKGPAIDAPLGALGVTSTDTNWLRLVSELGSVLSDLAELEQHLLHTALKRRASGTGFGS